MRKSSPWARAVPYALIIAVAATSLVLVACGGGGRAGASAARSSDWDSMTWDADHWN